MPHQKRLRLIPRKTILEGGLQAGDGAPAYDVAGLPADLAVEIAALDGSWQLRVVRDGESSGWQRDFETADDALAAIERELAQLEGRPDPF